MKIRGLETKYIGQIVERYDEIDSTNIRAKEWAKSGTPEGSIVLAESQSAGKGRLGRTWLSPKGTGIWMSIILRPHISPQQISQVTLVAGMSMRRAISEVTGLEAKIKWPNDIIVGEKKVCGILTEMAARANHAEYVVVGIGVNVNDESLDEAIPHATSLALEGGCAYDREQIIIQFANIFEGYYEVFLNTGNLGGLIKEYKDNCINLGKQVRISNNQEEYIAYVEDIDVDGSLIIKKADGRCETIFTGEVSVRGLYGYV